MGGGRAGAGKRGRERECILIAEYVLLTRAQPHYVPMHNTHEKTIAKIKNHLQNANKLKGLINHKADDAENYTRTQHSLNVTLITSNVMA